MGFNRSGAAAILAMLAARGSPAVDRAMLGSATADPGERGVRVDVSITHDLPIHSLSVAMAFDASTFQLAGITAEGTVTGDLGVDFFYPTIDNVKGNAVLGIFYSEPVEPFTLRELEASPDTPQRVAVLVFDFAADARPGDYPIGLVNEIGSPPVSTVFSTRGFTTWPDLRGGTLTVRNRNIFLLDDLKVRPGSRIDVNVSAKHLAPLQGYSIAFTFDKAILTFVAATCEGTDAARSVVPEKIEVFEPKLEEDFLPGLSRITAGAVLDYVAPWDGQEVPPSPDNYQTLARFTFDVADRPSLIGRSIPLTFRDAGVTSVNNIIVVNLASYTPALIDGKIDFVQSPIFQRGDINGDDSLDISDGIFALSHLFLGGEAPPCLSAADVNDDDTFDISDPIYIFYYLFLGGSKPRPPFEACGPDPTPDPLTCYRSPTCP